MDNLDEGSSVKLNYLRQEINSEIEEGRRRIRDRYFDLISNWEGPLPDLRSIFLEKEIEGLLFDSVRNFGDSLQDNHRGQVIIDFVIRTGYKDEPEVDRDGKPICLRTTPVHSTFDNNFSYFVADLFQIYDKFDVNYTDDFGLSHFHAACESGCRDVVEKFLELGLDPKQLVTDAGDSPLHMALRYEPVVEIIELLLKHGCDPNLPNEKGFTPLHVLCIWNNSSEFADILLSYGLRNGTYKLEQDAQDKFGDTPLNYALKCHSRDLTEWLLMRADADPNLSNEEGLTPLHIVCNDREHAHELAELLFETSDKRRRKLQVDARDKLGRTPLQWAVASLNQGMVDVLLDRGADLADFVFPTESHLDERFEIVNYHMKLIRLLEIVKCLEKRGYKLDRSDALIIMKMFAKHELFEKSTDLEKCWYDDEEFAIEAKKLTIKPDLSLYDLIQLQPKEAEKLLTFTDCFKLSLWNLPERLRGTCDVHLHEKASRRFFLLWSLVPFLELTRYQLPILCCEIILEQLMNEDLYKICLAAADQSSELTRDLHCLSIL